jgi:hypothetical protein
MEGEAAAMRWWALAFGMAFLLLSLRNVHQARIENNATTRTQSARVAVLTAVWAGCVLAIGIRPTPLFTEQALALVLTVLGIWLPWYPMMPPRALEGYRRLPEGHVFVRAYVGMKASIVLWFVGLGLAIFLLATFHDSFFTFAIFSYVLLIVVGGGGIVLGVSAVVAVRIGLKLYDTVEMEAWRRGRR